MRTERIGGFVAAAIAALFAAIISVGLSTSASATPYIEITDLSEGSPGVTSSGVDLTNLVFGPETVSFSGVLHIPLGAGKLLSSSYSFVLTEPGGGISDIATVTLLTPGAGIVGPDDFLQEFNFTFTSVDGLTGWTQGTDCVLVETGAVQTCSLIGDPHGGLVDLLDLRIQSDVEQSVPEPSTLALIGIALLSLIGLGLLRRRQRWAASRQTTFGEGQPPCPKDWRIASAS